LDELGFGLVAGTGDAHQLPLGQLGLDLPCASVTLGDRFGHRQRRTVDERHPAARAEALLEPVRRAAGGTDERLGRHHSTLSSAASTCPWRIVNARTSGASSASPTMMYSASG